MIRFVPLPSKTENFTFAWLDTTTDRFIELGELQRWSSWDHFAREFEREKPDDGESLKAFVTLFNDYFTEQTPTGHWQPAELPEPQPGSRKTSPQHDHDAVLGKFRKEAQKRKQLLEQMREML